MINERITKLKTIEKGWGVQLFSQKRIGELICFQKDCEVDNVEPETVKVLYFDKGKRLSKHFHKNKDEYFICVLGELFIELWKSENDTPEQFTLNEGERIFVPKGLIHRMTGLKDLNILLEVSTLDKAEDSYRIEKGD